MRKIKFYKKGLRKTNQRITKPLRSGLSPKGSLSSLSSETSDSLFPANYINHYATRRIGDTHLHCYCSSTKYLYFHRPSIFREITISIWQIFVFCALSNIYNGRLHQIAAGLSLVVRRGYDLDRCSKNHQLQTESKLSKESNDINTWLSLF